MRWAETALLVLLTAPPGLSCRDGGSRLDIVVPGNPGEPVLVTGLAPGDVDRLRTVGEDEWPSVLAVYVANEDRIPAILGEWELVDSRLEFRPRFPFVPEQEYHAIFTLGGTRREARFVLEASPPPVEVTVLRVYPTGDFLPENLLRFYIYFSASMQGGDVYRSIYLENAAGERIEQAFVETVPELWTPEMRRVTMLLHPGRIKQGLEMSEREGLPLRQGEEYRLVVDVGMRSTGGATLGEEFEKRFSVGKADRRSPDPKRWKIEAPSAGSRGPLRIHLREPLDHALLQRFLSVRDRDGTTIEGTLTVIRGEKLCFYVPGLDWAAGEYELVVRPALEDLAGNRVDMLFDRKSTPPPSEREAIRLPFSVSEPDSGGQE